MKIGFVLSVPPGYSETFFKNKFKLLSEINSEIYLFVDNMDNSCNGNCIVGFSMGNGFVRDSYKIVIVLKRILNSPIRTFLLFNKNRLDGFGLLKNIRSIFISAHILKYNLDWLHFGFCTMAVGRENISQVIGAKMAVSIRGYDITIFPHKNPGCYNNVWKRIDKLHYISNSLLNLAIANGFSKIIEHHRITPAIDIVKFKYQGPRNNNILKIATTARLTWVKGLKYVINALGILKKLDILFEYIIIGDGEDLLELIELAKEVDIFNQVIFAGKKSQDDIIDILKLTDIYIQYSVHEGFGNSVLEAQSMGCICIVSDAEGLTENIINNETGFIVEKCKSDLLANKLIEVMNLDEKCKFDITSRSMKRVEAIYNINVQKQKFLDFYQC